MDTPSFFEKHQEKARPKITLKGRNLSSVFSPIPCKPQSEYSLFEKVATPQIECSPISSKLPIQYQKSVQRITPVHFLKTAEPAASPKVFRGIQRLFGQLKQTPKQMRAIAGETSSLHIFKNSSCSNFYERHSSGSFSRIASPMVTKALI
jgi:hypothetical protein